MPLRLRCACGPCHGQTVTIQGPVVDEDAPLSVPDPATGRPVPYRVVLGPDGPRLLWDTGPLVDDV